MMSGLVLSTAVLYARRYAVVVEVLLYVQRNRRFIRDGRYAVL